MTEISKCEWCGEPSFASAADPATGLCRNCGALMPASGDPKQPAKSPDPFPRQFTFDALRRSAYSPKEKAKGDSEAEEPHFNFVDGPSTCRSTRTPPASRTRRFFGAVIDAAAFALLTNIGLWALHPKTTEEAWFTVIHASCIMMAIQSLLIGVYGQSIGKMFLGMRIVNSNNDEHPGFWRAVVVRYWFQGLLAIIPFYALLDALCIFGQGNCCLHDTMAGTRVINCRE